MVDNDTLYARWLSGEITDAEKQEMESSEAFKELNAVINEVDTWSIPTYNKNAATDRIKQMMQKEIGAESKVRVLSLRKVLSMAASVAILCGVLYLWQVNMQWTYATGKSSFTLADDTEIILNDGSSFRTKIDNALHNRKVWLKGEAYFSVEKGGSFIVSTDNGDIEVLGTQFNVRAWDDILQVECYEGKVQVYQNEKQLIITAGEAIRAHDGSSMTKSTITSNQPMWQQEASAFYNERLASVFSELERQFGLHINTSNFNPNRRFSGTFTHNDVEQALSEICIPMGLSFTLSDDHNSFTISQ